MYHRKWRCHLHPPQITVTRSQTVQGKEMRAFPVPSFMFVCGCSLKLVDFIFVAQIIYWLLKISITHVLCNSAELNVKVSEAPRGHTRHLTGVGAQPTISFHTSRNGCCILLQQPLSLGVSRKHCPFWVQGIAWGSWQSSQDTLLVNTKDLLYWLGSEM